MFATYIFIDKTNLKTLEEGITATPCPGPSPRYASLAHGSSLPGMNRTYADTPYVNERYLNHVNNLSDLWLYIYTVLHTTICLDNQA